MKWVQLSELLFIFLSSNETGLKKKKNLTRTGWGIIPGIMQTSQLHTYKTDKVITF